MAEKGEEEPTGEAYWLSVIAKALALLCLHNADLQDADIGTKGDLLTGLGLRRKDIAIMLDTTEETVRKSMEQSRRSGRSKRDKSKKKG